MATYCPRPTNSIILAQQELEAIIARLRADGYRVRLKLDVWKGLEEHHWISREPPLQEK